MNNDDNIKKEIKQEYGKIALSGNADSCCMPSECCSTETNGVYSPIQSTQVIGYDSAELASIPQSSILGVGCGNPKVCSYKRKRYSS